MIPSLNLMQCIDTLIVANASNYCGFSSIYRLVFSVDLGAMWPRHIPCQQWQIKSPWQPPFQPPGCPSNCSLRWLSQSADPPSQLQNAESRSAIVKLLCCRSSCTVDQQTMPLMDSNSQIWYVFTFSLQVQLNDWILMNQTAGLKSLTGAVCSMARPRAKMTFSRCWRMLSSLLSKLCLAETKASCCGSVRLSASWADNFP